MSSKLRREGPFGHSEQLHQEVVEHRIVVVDPAVDDTVLPALEARFGLSVIVNRPDRQAAFEAKLAERAAARERIRSAPATIAMLAAAREGERSEFVTPVVPIGNFVQQPQTFEQRAEQLMVQQPQVYEGQPPMANAA